MNADKTKPVVNSYAIAHPSGGEPAAINTPLTSSSCNTTNIICSRETNTNFSSSMATKDYFNNSLENIAAAFEEFLENFKDDAAFFKYVYKVKVYSHLCATIKNIVFCQLHIFMKLKLQVRRGFVGPPYVV